LGVDLDVDLGDTARAELGCDGLDGELDVGGDVDLGAAAGRPSEAAF
jgi:hypothetical protein